MRRHSSLHRVLFAVVTGAVSCSPDADVTDETGAPVDSGAPSDSGSPSDSGTPADSGDTASSPAELSEDRIVAHVEELASEAYAGRGTATEGGEMATQYLEEHFARIGLSEAGDEGAGYRHAFEVRQFLEVSPAELEIEGTDYTEDRDFVLFTPSGSGDVTADVVFAGYGLTVPAFDPETYPDCPLDPEGYDDYQGLDAEGRIVLVFRHGPNDSDAIYDHCPANEASQGDPSLYKFGYKAANAALHGASAMMLVTDYHHADGAASSGTLGDEYYQADFPALWLDRDVAETWWPDLEQWQETIDTAVAPASQATGVEARVFVDATYEPQTVYNVLGSLPGTDPDVGDEMVMVCAHFDHLGTTTGGDIYYGADDNASGTAVMMELARVLADRLPEPERTVLFAGWNAEEIGLVGSAAWAASEAASLSRMVAVLNLDMVGGGDESGLDVYGGLSPQLSWIVDLMNATADTDTFTVNPTVTLGASDHASFSAYGVPAVLLLTAGEHLYYHTPQDTADTVSGYEMLSTAQVTWGALEALALAEESSYVDRPRTYDPPASPPPPAFPVNLTRLRSDL